VRSRRQRSGGVFSIYNATITAVGPYTWAGEVRQIQLTYTVSGTSGTKDVTIAVGAHLARQNDGARRTERPATTGASGKISANFDSARQDVAVSVNPGAAVSAGVTISGIVHNDANSNLTVDAGETGLPGGPVTATGPISDTAVTSSSGGYTFSDVDPGTYSLDYTVPTGFVNTGTKPLTAVVAAGGTAPARTSSLSSGSGHLRNRLQRREQQRVHRRRRAAHRGCERLAQWHEVWHHDHERNGVYSFTVCRPARTPSTTPSRSVREPRGEAARIVRARGW
jgi:hypothetical protein